MPFIILRDGRCQSFFSRLQDSGLSEEVLHLLMANEQVKYMAIRFLFLVILIASCGRALKEQNPDLKSDSVQVQSNKAKETSIDSSTVKMNLKADSLEKKAFWDAVVIPILKKDKKVVLENMNFPVLGHWTQMMEMKKEPIESTREDFARIYDRFFNAEFLNILSKQSVYEIGTDKKGDTIRYFLTIQDTSGMSAVQLVFYKHGEKYTLKGVQGAGGNFYSK